MRGRLPALAVVCTVLAAEVAGAGAARAQGLPLRIAVDPCVAIDAARLAELLTLELRVLTESGGPAPRGLTQVRVTCAGPAVTLAVSDREGGPPALRQLDWSTYPAQGRPRLLALALSEMIARSWASLAPASGPAPAPTVAGARAPAPPPAPPSPPPLAAPRLQLSALATVERIGRPRELAAGLDLAFGWRPRPWLLAQLGGRASATTFAAAPGEVSARTLSMFVAALAGGGHGRLWAGAGPGLRGGWAWLRGNSGSADPSGRTLAAAWWGPVVIGTIAIQLGQHLLLLATVEGGYVARPVVGQVGPTSTDATVALDQTWLAAAAGAGWRF